MPGRVRAALLIAVLLLAACSSHHAKPATNGEWSPGASSAKLPLSLDTRDATQVVTVVSKSLTATSATLQAWQRTSGGHWQRFGPPITGFVGSGGLTRAERDTSTASPIGSFTLTQAFGRLPNPGTRLHYTQTTPNSWWVSEPGPLYNTLQYCAGSCPFRTGSPNSRLYYVTPQYNLAIVIDDNTRNAPNGAVPGAGTGIFLHVAANRPTAGCVSIPADALGRILRWLDPAAHPRILIGVAATH